MRIKVIALIMTAFGFVGCDKSDGVDIDLQKPVIEGWIDNDGHPVVLFSRPLSPSGSGNLSDNLIRWGKVTISDGESEVILTGGQSDEYFPPYRYYSIYMEGKTGRTYTLTAEYGDMKATATTTIYEPTPIKTIAVSPVADNDTLRDVVLKFDAPADVPAYYYVTIKDRESEVRSYPALLGSIEAEDAEAEMTLSLMRPKVDVFEKKYIPQFPVGHTFLIELCRIGKAEYDFWHRFDDITAFGGGNLISSTSELPSNVAGGYGIWCGRGVSRKVITIE